MVKDYVHIKNRQFPFPKKYLHTNIQELHVQWIRLTVMSDVLIKLLCNPLVTGDMERGTRRTKYNL